MRTSVMGILLATCSISATAAPPGIAPTYPHADASGGVETRAGGIRVSDPYRWLEGNVRTDSRVQAWVADEVKVTNAYLSTLPRRDAISKRLTELWNFEKYGVPHARAGRVFYRHNTGLQNQYTLDVIDAPGAAPRQLLDPSGWSKDGATALAEWEPSPDGRHLVYTVQDGGTDWRTFRVIDVATGKMLRETLAWGKFTGLAWDGKSEGFFYSRYPARPGGADFTSAVFNHQIYYHRLGTEQSADYLVFRSRDPKFYNDAATTKDGHWLVIFSGRGSDSRYEVTLVDLTKRGWTPRTLVAGLDNNWVLAGHRHGLLYFATDKGAPKMRVVSMDPATGAVSEIVPEGPGRIEEAAIVGDRLIVDSLVDAKSEVTSYPLTGGTGTRVPLPGIGTVSGLTETLPQEDSTYLSFASFAQPSTIYRLKAARGSMDVFARPETPFNPNDYETRQVFYASKDGTRIPLFITRKKSVVGPAPTLLYGYGGFDISLPPSFSPATIDWMEMGGVYALANIRGGGEYGVAWHDAGKLFKKQNVFDDFISAGEWLKANGVTTPGGLAIQGGSNGGLLIGAVVNQRPDLMAAALPAVGVMDMTRFHLFTEGRTWTDDYGDPSDPAALKYQLTYSPYHNVRPGVTYPAILATTADTDDRVVPGHTFKYTAALQAANIGPKPHLVRIETRAGHGSGKPTAKLIAEIADEWAFIGYWTGLTK